MHRRPAVVRDEGQFARLTKLRGVLIFGCARRSPILEALVSCRRDRGKPRGSNARTARI